MAKKKETAARKQVGAAPVRIIDDTVRVLLVTSRETRRWIIPKGWPMPGLSDRDAAAREAREEAGVVGTVTRRPFGTYSYLKRLADRFEVCRVKVYILDVEVELDDWREQTERAKGWFRLQDAADLVDEPELKTLLMSMRHDTFRLALRRKPRRPDAPIPAAGAGD
jgi:8-oxo-dGTP pyrophosphatase MutT (NUDIX family)